jgi:hypothetical protein
MTGAVAIKPGNFVRSPTPTPLLLQCSQGFVLFIALEILEIDSDLLSEFHNPNIKVFYSSTFLFK